MSSLVNKYNLLCKLIYLYILFMIAIRCCRDFVRCMRFLSMVTPALSKGSLDAFFYRRRETWAILTAIPLGSCNFPMCN